MDKAIHLLPRNAGNYINRALARVSQTTSEAMSDYDTALDIDPDNFWGIITEDCCVRRSVMTTVPLQISTLC